MEEGLGLWLGLTCNTQDTTPPRATCEAEYLDDVESANAGRCVYGKIWTRSSQKSPFFCCICLLGFTLKFHPKGCVIFRVLL